MLKYAPAARVEKQADRHGPLLVDLTAALTAAVEYGKRQAGIPLTFSLNLRCRECKETAAYSWATEDARDAYQQAWDQWHAVPGHRPALYKPLLALPDPDAKGQMKLF